MTMTESQIKAVEEHLGLDRGLWYEHGGRVYRLATGLRTDVSVTSAGNVRLGTRTLVYRDGTTTPIR